MIHHTLLLCTALGLASPAEVAKVGKAAAKADVTAEQEVGDLSGFYQCKGQELGGKTYTGVCMLVKKNDVYLIQWMVTGGSTFTGIAIRQGNTLAASWAIPNDRGVVRGVNLYRIETSAAGPRLTGRWTTMPGPGALQNEALTFLKKLDTEEE